MTSGSRSPAGISKWPSPRSFSRGSRTGGGGGLAAGGSSAIAPARSCQSRPFAFSSPVDRRRRCQSLAVLSLDNMASSGLSLVRTAAGSGICSTSERDSSPKSFLAEPGAASCATLPLAGCPRPLTRHRRWWQHPQSYRPAFARIVFVSRRPGYPVDRQGDLAARPGAVVLAKLGDESSGVLLFQPQLVVEFDKAESKDCPAYFPRGRQLSVPAR